MGDDLPRLGELILRSGPRTFGLAKVVRCLALAKGELVNAAGLASTLYPNEQGVQAVLKAAVTAGSMADLDWAQPLTRSLQTEFIQAAQGLGVLSRLAAVRRVPFGVRVARTISSSTVGWVGEAQSKPVSALSFADAFMPVSKVSGIVVFTAELAKMSSPSAESVIRNDLVVSTTKFIDSQFSNPANTGSTTHPNSIFEGTTPVASTGTTPAAISTDLGTVFAGMVTAGGSLEQIALIANPITASKINLSFASGAASLPFPLFVSAAVPSGMLGIVDQSQVLLADDGGIEIDVAKHATLQLDSAPATPPTAVVSLWQMDLFGVRADRIISWAPVADPKAAAGRITGL